MKKIPVVIFALVFALAFAGCASQPAAPPAPPVVSDGDMPPWINEQPPAGMLWGIGVSSNAQQNMRLTMADSAARQDLARQLSVLAQGMVTDYARESGGVKNTTAVQFQESISRQLTNVTIQGAVRDLMWTTSDRKTLWMRVKVSKADASKTIDDMTQKAIDSEAGRYAEFKAMEAAKMMDQALQKNPQSPQPVGQ